MAPGRKRQGTSALVIPLIDPNSQLPFCGNYASIVSEFGLLHLVEIGVLSPSSSRPYAFACDKNKKGKKKAPTSSSSSEEEKKKVMMMKMINHQHHLLRTKKQSNALER
jgi:hypothetical protein